MKTLKSLSLLACGTISANELRSAITMFVDEACGGCNYVQTDGGSPQYSAEIETNQSGKLFVTFPPNFLGRYVRPISMAGYTRGWRMCVGDWIQVKEGVTLSCPNPPF